MQGAPHPSLPKHASTLKAAGPPALVHGHRYGTTSPTIQQGAELDAARA